MAAAASECSQAMASAMWRASVKVLYALSGLAARISGVTIAFTTRMFAVPRVSASSSANASVHASAAAFAAA